MIGGILDFNKAAQRLFGYTPQEVVGKNVKMLMPAPYHGAHDGYIKNYLETGEAKVFGSGREVRAQRKNGSVFPMDLGVSEMVIDEKKLFVGTIRDISWRKTAQQDLSRFTRNIEKTNEQLNIKNSLLQAVLDNTVDGIMTIDQVGIVQSFNKACANILGMTLRRL